MHTYKNHTPEELNDWFKNHKKNEQKLVYFTLTLKKNNVSLFNTQKKKNNNNNFMIRRKNINVKNIVAATLSNNVIITEVN